VTTLTTYDGLELAVTTYGPETAPVAVLLGHCWTSDQDDWRYQVRDLLREFGHGIRIVAWDHRGHGLSQPTPKHDCTIDNLARDMSDVIDALAPHGRLFLAGHSIGGMTIMALAEQRPELFEERVAGAVFVSTSSGDMESVNLGLPEVGKALRTQIPRMLALRSRTLSKRARRRAPIIERLVMRKIVFGHPQRVRDTALAVEGLIKSPAATMVGFYEDCMRHERTAAVEVLDAIPPHVLVGATG